MHRKIHVLVDNRKVTQSAIDQAITLAQTHRANIFFFSMLPHSDCPEVVGTEDQNAEVEVLSGSIIAGLIAAATVPVLVCRDRPVRLKCPKHRRSSFAINPLIHREVGTRKDDEPND